jgi:putative transposase
VICGLPGTLYTDHGSDFTSQHLEQVASDLHIRLSFSTPSVPQGRGKIERLFESITTELALRAAELAEQLERTA